MAGQSSRFVGATRSAQDFEDWEDFNLRALSTVLLCQVDDVLIKIMEEIK